MADPAKLKKDGTAKCTEGRLYKKSRSQWFCLGKVEFYPRGI